MTDRDLDVVRDDTYRKIGRNIYAFQRMESIIKFLLARSRLEGPMDQLRAVRAKTDGKILKVTMGGLIEPFISQIYVDDAPANLRLEGLDRAWISVSYKIEADQSHVEERKLKLNKLVSERNRLVHQMIGGSDIDSIDSCIQLCDELDVQYELVKPEYDDLHSIMEAMQSCLKEAAERLMAVKFSKE